MFTISTFQVDIYNNNKDISLQIENPLKNHVVLKCF